MLPEDLTDLSTELPKGPKSNRRLGIGEYDVIESPNRATCCGLGSCLAIILYDPNTGKGGVIHTLLPQKSKYPNDQDKESSRFTDSGIEILLKELLDEPNVRRSNVKAKIAGGSEVLEFVTFSTDVGKQNVEVAKRTLDKYNIDIMAEDVGGEYGRTVIFDPATGGVIVKKANGDKKVI